MIATTPVTAFAVISPQPVAMPMITPVTIPISIENINTITLSMIQAMSLLSKLACSIMRDSFLIYDLRHWQDRGIPRGWSQVQTIVRISTCVYYTGMQVEWLDRWREIGVIRTIGA